MEALSAYSSTVESAKLRFFKQMKGGKSLKKLNCQCCCMGGGE